LIISFLSFAQQKTSRIIVSLDSDKFFLNMRESPNEKSRIMLELENGYSLYATGDFQEGWVQVWKGIHCETYDDVHDPIVRGWVHKDFVKATNFKSNVLEKVPDSHFYGAGGIVVEGLEGALIGGGGREMYCIIQGQEIELQYNYATGEYHAEEILIQEFLIQKGEDCYGGYYQGFIIINYKDTQEIIFVKKREFGC